MLSIDQLKRILKIMKYDSSIPELNRVKIKVVSIAFKNSNTINHMQNHPIKGVDFECVDSYQLTNQQIEGTDLLFLIADTGELKSIEISLAIAKRARELNILTVAIIATNDRADNITELEQCVDSLIAISNKNAAQVNELSLNIVRGISGLITQQGLIGFDFSDAKTVLKDTGRGFLGVGSATGINRAKNATEKALSCLNGIGLRAAGGILVNISATNMDLAEFDEIGNIVDNLASETSIIKIGVTLDESLDTDVIKVTLITTMLDGYIPNKQ